MNGMTRYAGFAIVAAALLVAGCSDRDVTHPLQADTDFDVVGSLRVVDEDREVGGITAVDMRAVGKLYIRQGGSESLRVRAEDNLLPLILTEMHGSTLVIRVAQGGSYRTHHPFEFYLTVSRLDRIDISGVASVEATNLTGGRLELLSTGVGGIRLAGLDVGELDARLEGLATLEASGSSHRQRVTLLGSGDYSAGSLASLEADVTIEGRGSATVRVSDRLDVTIDGSGDVRYFGSPAVTCTGSGSGQCTPLD